MPNNLIILSDGEKLEAWVSMKTICEHKNLPYYTLCRKKFPFIYKKICFYKIDTPDFKHGVDCNVYINWLEELKENNGVTKIIKNE